MYARAVDDAGTRLRELRHEEWERLGVGALALGLALGATQVVPPLALPLFLGGVAVGASGLRAVWRHWDLLELLCGERDAYVIPEVRARGSREAAMDRRRSFAAVIRGTLVHPARAFEAKTGSVVEELEALAAELDDAELELDPVCAVACMRLVSEPESPLFGPETALGELRSRVRQIRAGFSSGRSAI
jgi:hypothetical protein